MKCSYGLGGRGCHVSENGAGRSSSEGWGAVSNANLLPLSLSGPSSTSSLDTGLLVQAGQGGSGSVCAFWVRCVGRQSSLCRVWTVRDFAEKGGGRGDPGRGVKTASEQTAFFFPHPH